MVRYSNYHNSSDERCETNAYGFLQTGAGTYASKLGKPDLDFATLNDMREHVEMIANSNPSVPLIADADTEYGGNIPSVPITTIPPIAHQHLQSN